MWTESFQIFKLDLQKAEEPEDKLPISVGLKKSMVGWEFHKNICLIDYAKAFDCVDHNKPWKILQDGNARPPYLSPENLYEDQ